jgi:diaminopropionate ammonia-lyase
VTGWYSRPEARAWRTDPAPADAHVFHTSLPSYAPTPLVELPELAAELGAGRVLVKDESARLGLPAFKVLGASWAVYRTLTRRFERGSTVATRGSRRDLPVSLDELRESLDGRTELVTATDGNHGRAVAWMARLLGLPARVFVPEVAGAAVRTAIESEGAEVVVVPDSYDAAVMTAHRVAREDPDRLLVQDTAWPGYEEIPRLIVDGYSTLFREIDQQLGKQGAGLVVVPMGVGSLAQAAVVHYRSGAAAPAVLGVEPDTAACVTESLLAGRPVSVPTAATIMAGLNCGTPSSLAWPVLRDGMDAAVTVDDTEAALAVADLTRLGVSSGPSGAATLAGARAALTRRPSLAGPATTVVLLNTEAHRPPP